VIRIALAEAGSPYLHAVEVIHAVVPDPAPRDLRRALSWHAAARRPRSTAPQLRERLWDLMDAGHNRLPLEMDGVDFCDSTALSVLVATHARLDRHDGHLQLVTSHAPLRKILAITSLDRVFNVHASMNPALATC
jgi:anti-sigma B factor antagonist